MSEEDFLDDLDNDFGETSEEENNFQDESIAPNLPTPVSSITVVNPQQNTTEELVTDLSNVVQRYQPFSLAGKIIEDIDVDSLSPLLQLGSNIRAILESDDIQLDKVHSTLNEIMPLLSSEIEVVHKYMIMIYSKKFPELDTLIPDAKQYATVVNTIENLTAQGYDIPTFTQEFQNKGELNKEQNLVVLMSMKTSFKNGMSLGDSVLSKLTMAKEHIISLTELRGQISDYISSKINEIAPNVCALVGPQIASLLIAHAGGILGLSRIPNCNLASIGKAKHLSHEQHTVLGGLRQNGYISNSDIIQKLPATYHKQMVRMLSAKISLASRVDCSQLGGNKNNAMGLKWREEIEGKIRKLHETPNVGEEKALPIPEDKPKKKRAGRKFRKYKEQFQISNMRQLQNRMEFGKQETTVTDVYGDEVGLGMMNTSAGERARANSGRVSKMSKRMKRRVAEANEQSPDMFRNLDGKS